MTKSELAKFHCTLEAAVAVMCGKYKAIIIWWLDERKVMRFSELQRAIPQATAKMLSQQLREMEADELVARKVYPVIPPKTEYRLTGFGESAVKVVKAMDAWAGAYYRHFGVEEPCEAEMKSSLREGEESPSAKRRVAARGEESLREVKSALRAGEE